MGKNKAYNDSQDEIIDAIIVWRKYLAMMGKWHAYHYRECCDHVITSMRDDQYSKADKRMLKDRGTLTPGLETGLIRYAFHKRSPRLPYLYQTACL